MTARALGVLGIAALVALGALAVRWDDPGPGVITSASAAPAPGGGKASTTTSTTSGVTTSTPVTSVPSPTPGVRARSRSSTPSTTAAPHAAVPTVHPGALHRPRPGRYPIRVTSGGTTTDGTLTVDAEQWQRRAVGDDQRAELLVWDRQGALLASSGEPGDGGACDWDHQALEVPTDLAEGRTWSSKVGCDSTIAGRSVHLERVETADVRARARTQLAGAPVDAWVIDRRVVLSIEGRGIATVTDATSTELFVPDLGLAVFTASRTKVPQPDGTVRTIDASEELLQKAPVT